MNIQQRLADISPMLCRLLARKRYGKPLTTLEISEASGLSPIVVEAYSWSTGWDDIPILHALSFAKACGVDLLSSRETNRVHNYLWKSPTFEYLRRDPAWRTYYQPMLVRWHASFGPSDRTNETVWKPIRRLLRRLDSINVARLKG